MPNFSVNISNIIITNEEYRKLKAYAGYHQISIHQGIRLLIDSLSECSQTNNKLSQSYPFIFPRRFLYLALGDR